jgi:hypothetical protein
VPAASSCPGGRAGEAGNLPRQEAGAIVFLKERWVPALGPEGDDVFDLDPRWRQ